MDLVVSPPEWDWTRNMVFAADRWAERWCGKSGWMSGHGFSGLVFIVREAR
jgi:hypothetical protein